MGTILIVDDEPEIIRITRGYLEQAGFSVQTATNAADALSALRHGEFELVILDLNLPSPADAPPIDGLDVARAIRQAPGPAAATPIIMLTARVDEMDRIIGLELGADDYITKPFSPREMVARVRAVLRRATPWPVQPEESPMIRAGRLVIDPARRKTLLDGQPIDLTPTEFTILLTMAAAQGRVFSRGQLLDALGPDSEGLERTIDSHIKNLRIKLQDDPREPRFIHTVFGAGYKFGE